MCNICSIVTSVIASWLLWFSLKPRLKIEIDHKDGEGISGENHNTIRIKVTNKSCCFDAINLKMEVCSVKDENFTCQISVDKDDFIVLPRGNERTFKTTEKSVKVTKKSVKVTKKSVDLIEKLSEKDVKLRVRVHAAHSLSGYGKVFQAHFRYDPETNSFDEVKFCELRGITILWYKKKAQWRKV